LEGVEVDLVFCGFGAGTAEEVAAAGFGCSALTGVDVNVVVGFD